MTVVASVQYHAVSQNAADAFYKLSNTKAQIQSYVFDGMFGDYVFKKKHAIAFVFLLVYFCSDASSSLYVLPTVAVD